MADAALTKRELAVLWPSIEELPRKQRAHISNLRRWLPHDEDRPRLIKGAQQVLAEKRAIRDKTMRQLGISWPPWGIHGVPG